MPTLTITTDKGDITVESTAIKSTEGLSFYESDKAPAGFVPVTEHTAKIEAATKGLKNPAELVTDDGFFKRMMKQRGMEYDPSTLKPIGQLSDEHRQQLARVDNLLSENKRMKEMNQSLLGDIQQSRTTSLKAKLRNQMDQPETYVKRDKLESIFPGKDPPFLSECASQWEWSDTHKTHVFKDNEGNVVMNEGRPATEREFLTMLKSHAGDRVFDTPRQKGSNFNRPHIPAGKVLTKHAFDVLSPASKIQHFKDGGTVAD